MSRTGSGVAGICARGLSSGKRAVSDEEFRAVCASALNQYEALASYTDVKRRGVALKRRARKLASEHQAVSLFDVSAIIDELVAMAKPIPVSSDG